MINQSDHMNYNYQEVTPSPSTSDIVDSSQSSEDDSEIGFHHRVPTIVGRNIAGWDGVTITVLLASDHIKLAFSNWGKDVVDDIHWTGGWQDGADPLRDYSDNQTRSLVQLQLLSGLLSTGEPTRLKASTSALEDALSSVSFIEGLSQLPTIAPVFTHQLESPDRDEHQRLTVFEVVDDANDLQEALDEMFMGQDSQDEDVMHSAGFPSAFFEYLAPVMVIDLRAWVDVIPVIYPSLYKSEFRPQWERRRERMVALDNRRGVVESKLERINHYQSYRVYDLLRLAGDALRSKNSDVAEDLDQAKQRVDQAVVNLEDELSSIDQDRSEIFESFAYSGEGDTWNEGLTPYRLVGVAIAPVAYFARRGNSWIHCQGGVCGACTEEQVLSAASRARFARLVYECSLPKRFTEAGSLVAPSVKRFFDKDAEMIAHSAAAEEAAAGEAASNEQETGAKEAEVESERGSVAAPNPEIDASSKPETGYEAE